MKTTVLFPGSFNPIHYGHIAIAEYLARQSGVDEVRIVVSPHNPLKGEAAATPQERLMGVWTALMGRTGGTVRTGIPLLNHLSDSNQAKDTFPPTMHQCLLTVPGTKFTVSDIEFSLPEPRYTLNTLQVLRAEEPQTRFILAVGGDNILILEKWHRWEEILATTELWVYPRPGYPDAEARIRELNATPLPSGAVPVIRFLSDSPQNDISSTRIRERLAGIPLGISTRTPKL